jgi:hypothetical protein
MRKRHLTPEQTERVNRTLRHLAEDLERKKAERQAETLAREVAAISDELAAPHDQA